MRQLSLKAKLGIAGAILVTVLVLRETAQAGEVTCYEYLNCTYCEFGPGGVNGYVKWCKPEK